MGQQLLFLTKSKILQESLKVLINNELPQLDYLPCNDVRREPNNNPSILGDIVLIDTLTYPDYLAEINYFQKNNIKIIILTASWNKTAFDFLHQDIDGIFTLNMNLYELITGIKAVLNGYRFVPFHAFQNLIKRKSKISKKLSKRSSSKNLTKRESQVLYLFTKGWDNIMIAKKLNISLATVKGHINSVVRKMKVTNRTSAVAIAIREGWFSEYDMSQLSGGYH